MPHLYIMRALHIAQNSRKVNLDTIITQEPNCTILAALRYHGSTKSPVFIVASCVSDDIKRLDSLTYTRDTGNGYRDKNRALEIEHVITVRDGVIVKLDSQEMTSDTLPDFYNRHPYVLK